MKGQIVKIISDLHFVSFEDKIYPCKCRGIFRKEHIVPVVGDYVLFSIDTNIIEKVLERKNVFDRPKVSNIDQALLVTSLKCPDFSLNLLDKFICLMEINNVEPIICITKKDLLTDKEIGEIDSILDYYRSLGYKVLYNTELEEIKKIIPYKTTVFTGQTGAGKSSLLNRLNVNWNLEIGDVSVALGRGKHTTRVVELLEYCDGKVMDTPGFSALDLNKYSKKEIRESFREFSKYPCIYKDCTHTKESECVVKKNVNANNILKSRYLNYLSFIGEDCHES